MARNRWRVEVGRIPRIEKGVTEEPKYPPREGDIIERVELDPWEQFIRVKVTKVDEGNYTIYAVEETALDMIYGFACKRLTGNNITIEHRVSGLVFEFEIVDGGLPAFQLTNSNTTLARQREQLPRPIEQNELNELIRNAKTAAYELWKVRRQTRQMGLNGN